jgi:hypothetical protein
LSVYFSVSSSTEYIAGSRLNKRIGVKRGSANYNHCLSAISDRDTAPTLLIRLRPVIALTRAQSNLSYKEITISVWTKQKSGYPSRIARSYEVIYRDLPAEYGFRLCATDTDLKLTELRVPLTKYKSLDL